MQSRPPHPGQPRQHTQLLCPKPHRETPRPAGRMLTALEAIRARPHEVQGAKLRLGSNRQEHLTLHVSRFFQETAISQPTCSNPSTSGAFADIAGCVVHGTRSAPNSTLQPKRRKNMSADGTSILRFVQGMPACCQALWKQHLCMRKQQQSIAQSQGLYGRTLVARAHNDIETPPSTWSTNGSAHTHTQSQ